MTINENTFDMTVDQYDYGIPVTFETEEGFEPGDIIILSFDSEVLGDKEFRVTDADPFSFDFALTEPEANALFPEALPCSQPIAYSIKHKRNGAFLDSLKNAEGRSVFALTVERTVKYNGKAESA